MRLTSFCLQPDSTLFLAEHLTPEGVQDPLRALLVAEGRFSEAWLERFDQALAAYAKRAQALTTRAPREWGPVRLPNVCVAHHPQVAHPGYRPLWRSCWFVYASDFDPEGSTLEFSVYQLLRAEGLLLSDQNARATLLRNLGYVLTLDKAQLKQLRQGCRQTPRIDAGSYQALADALAWIPELTHSQLGRSPAAPRTPGGPPGPPTPVPGTDLVAPAWVRPRLEALLRRFETTAKATRERFQKGEVALAEPLGAPSLLAWLAAAAPGVLVTDRTGGILWDPSRPSETQPLAQAVASMGADQARDVQLDLERIDHHTRRFLAALPDPEALPMPSEEITQSDGTYLHSERRLVAYSLKQNSWEPACEPSPPLKRLALGARVVHEWGHLCEEADWIAAPEGARRETRKQVVKAFERLLAGVPKESRQLADREVASLEPGPSPGERLTRFALIRFPDYLANVLAQRFLDPPEMETYVRVNLCTHLGESITPLRHLARAALEYQYLLLSLVPDRLAYFYRISAIDQLFLEPGFVRRQDYERVLETLTAFCQAHRIETERFAQLPTVTTE